MNPTKWLLWFSLGGLAGCSGTEGRVAPAPAAAARETLAISVGPCFGFCPVYEAKIAPDGTVSFDGTRHTAVLGHRERKANSRTYESLARELAPFRPVRGETARVSCDAAISDTSAYTITWTTPSGRQTVATHQRGCTGGPGQALDIVLKRLPDQLGIAAWAKQITREGVSRG